MNILNNIFSKVFPSAQATVDNAVDAVKDKVENITTSVKNTVSSGSEKVQDKVEQSASATNVDVSSILENLAKKHPETLNWKTSIVDLLKLLGIDSSLDARKNLAKELNYPGNTDDTAAMNTWLIKEVMKKIAEKGGNVTHLFS
ncbi:MULTISPECIES: DUF3597 domain-containing protein [unclassified Gilliamella]|uniref:DUF3597 domain-containing protein n=1 Tax=unclassified Gilliamella TaxID=2685620 RepID=UPI000461CCA9|nr:DUF3597 domain-containing protein [Gilliamella apicola]KDN09301.1 hypothetical protein GAPWKB30_2093 [Gilliamella apicola]MCO6556315.1 DUF3597 domain-containing protein [Gilliamella sp.]OCG51177.1 hypothetical protein A9G38_00675 [Gilliamella apicola]OCG79229.1 hypothetical protein A9G44_12090 [Gilliamella apicola]